MKEIKEKLNSLGELILNKEIRNDQFIMMREDDCTIRLYIAPFHCNDNYHMSYVDKYTMTDLLRLGVILVDTIIEVDFFFYGEARYHNNFFKVDFDNNRVKHVEVEEFEEEIEPIIEEDDELPF